MREVVVTVVIPIYNVEQFLDRCIESVVNQSYQNLEIILVDDGSLDRCPEICDGWGKKDNRVKVIHKENAGIGMARNTGIENATGEYVCFVDSDDYIALDLVEKAYHLAKEKSVDIVLFGFYRLKEDGDIAGINLHRTEKLLYEGDEICSKLLPSLIAYDAITKTGTDCGMTVWGAFYSMQLIQRVNWRLVSERIFILEDFFSNLLLYKHVGGVAVLPEALYFYCENPTSITHTYRKDRYEKIKYLYDECIKTCGELGYCENVKNRLGHSFFSNTIGTLKIIAKADISESEKKAEMHAIFKDEHLHAVLRNADFNHEKISRKAFLTAVKYRLYTFARWMILLKCILPFYVCVPDCFILKKFHRNAQKHIELPLY